MIRNRLVKAGLKVWVKTGVKVLVCSLGLYACVYNDDAQLTAELEQPAITLSKQVLDNQSQPFLTHQGTGKFSRYLTQNIDYAPIKQLTHQLEKRVNQSLKNRGEAHITVITPVEFYETLRYHIDMAQIEQIALEADIQGAEFEPVCIGRGQITDKGEVLSTYYVVVKSDDLLDIRRRVHGLFVAAGGDEKAFDPEQFYPHITLGFNQRDLHISDGVVKNLSSCVYRLDLV